MRKVLMRVFLLAAVMGLCGCATPGRSNWFKNYRSAAIYFENSDKISAADMKPILDKIRSEIKKDLYGASFGWICLDETQKGDADLWIAISPQEYDLPHNGGPASVAAMAGAVLFTPVILAPVAAGLVSKAVENGDAGLGSPGKFTVNMLVFDAKNMKMVSETAYSAEYKRDPKSCAGNLARQITEYFKVIQ